MLPMSKASLYRLLNSVARSMSGALRQSRLSGQPRCAVMIQWESKDRLPKAGNPSRTGERSCVILWRLLRLLITAGRHLIVRTSQQASTCPQSSDVDWAKS